MTWDPVNLAGLPDRPTVKPSVCGLVYPGKRHVFSGLPESGKTLVAYALALNVVRDGGTVILIDFEMGQWDARGLLREMGATDSDLNSIAFIEPDSPADPKDTLALIELNPALIIIDSAAGAYDLHDLNDNQRGDVERFYRLYVKPFWKHGTAIIVLDHITKKGDPDFAIGSERKVGGIDVHLGFAAVGTKLSRGNNGLYRITTHKDRSGFLRRGRLADIEFHSNPESHALTWTILHTSGNPEPDDRQEAGRYSADETEAHAVILKHIEQREHDIEEGSQEKPHTLTSLEKIKGIGATRTRTAVKQLATDDAIEQTNPAGENWVKGKPNHITKTRPRPTASDRVPDVVEPRPADRVSQPPKGSGLRRGTADVTNGQKESTASEKRDAVQDTPDNPQESVGDTSARGESQEPVNEDELGASVVSPGNSVGSDGASERDLLNDDLDLQPGRHQPEVGDEFVCVEHGPQEIRSVAGDQVILGCGCFPRVGEGTTA